MNKDQKLIGKYMIMILGADDAKPVPSAEHLEWELFLLAKSGVAPGLMEAMERERIRLEKSTNLK